MENIRFGDTHRITQHTSNSSGAAQNADSTPTVVVLKHGLPMAYAPVVNNIGTGIYEVAIVCTEANGFVDNVEYSAYITVTVNGITGRDGLSSWRITTTGQIAVDDTIRVCFGTANAAGTAINADSLPTAVVLDSGSAMAYAPTVTNITTGVYEVAIVLSAANGFARDRAYSAYVTAVVAGVTGTDNITAFQITNAPLVPAENAATPQTIRDRAIAVIEALTPTSDTGVKFRAYRNEGGADMQDWAEKNPAACRRRFQVRTVGNTFTPPISNTDGEEHQVTLNVLVAYPQNGRDGKKQALDRDDTLDEDAFQIDKAIGMLGRANFSHPHPDACWIEGAPIARIVGVAVDFIEFVLTYIYRRTR